MIRKKTKLAMREEIVKYIFPTTDPRIVQGEDGYIIYDFKRLYPQKLGIFVPNEVDKSNYSAIFPRPFESYFTSMSEKAEFISRLLEIEIAPCLDTNLGIECMPGEIVDHNYSIYTIFRFDELVDPRKKIDILCRVDANNLTTKQKIKIFTENSGFAADAVAPSGTTYFYWIVSVNRLFRINDEMLGSIFDLASKLQLQNGPF